MFLEAKKILYLVAGTGYLEGENVVRILSIALIFAVYACFFSYSVLIPNRLEKYFLIATIIAAIVNIILNFYFIPLWDMNGAAITTLIAEILVCLISAYYAHKNTQVDFVSKDLTSVLISGIGIVLICSIIDNLIDNYIIALICDIFASVIVYAGLLFVFQNNIIRKLVKKKDLLRRRY